MRWPEKFAATAEKYNPIKEKTLARSINSFAVSVGEELLQRRLRQIDVALPRKLPTYRASLAGHLLAAREAVMAPIRPILRNKGVTEQQWRILRVLINGGAMNISRLATNAMLHPPSLTRILRELHGRQLVKRKLDRTDARRSIVTISASGRKLVDQTMVAYLGLLDHYAEAFGIDRLRALLSELELLTATISDPSRIVAND